MPERNAEAVWTGGLRDGSGKTRTASGAVDVAYSFKTRFEESPGTNPEELIGAAHAACFSMALAAGLEKAGLRPERIETKARVTFEKSGDGFAITRIHLTTRGSVPGVDEATFRQHAEKAKETCPVSKALAGVSITLDASPAR